MEKKTINKLDIDYYHEVLENGLEIFLVPMEFKKTYATFSAKYGSKHKTFRLKGSEEYITMPDGMAHFLEHKMFEMESGEKPFDFFAKSGANCNAYTSRDRTTYLFRGFNNLKKNICYLLDYVQSPYLTEKNIEKEKGIIEQELKMYEDDSNSVIYEKSAESIFENTPYGKPIGGTIESVRSTTKEQVEMCYNTFYHPSNMFLVITGKFNPNEILELIKNNQSSKNYKKQAEIEIKKEFEKSAVSTSKIEIIKDVNIPKLSVNFKLHMGKFDIKRVKLEAYLEIFRKCKLGWYSNLTKYLQDNDLIEGEIGSSYEYEDDYAGLFIKVTTNNIDVVAEKIREEISLFDINEELFERKRKTIKSNYLYSPDSVTYVNNIIMSVVTEEGYFADNFMQDFDDLNFEEFKSVFKNMDFSNNNIVIVKK